MHKAAQIFFYAHDLSVIIAKDSVLAATSAIVQQSQYKNT